MADTQSLADGEGENREGSVRSEEQPMPDNLQEALEWFMTLYYDLDEEELWAQAGDEFEQWNDIAE